MAEHLPDVPQLLHLAIAGDAMLQHRANTGRSPFRTQCERVTVAVFEGVHFLFDDIGHFTDRALEQLGELHDGRADLAVPVGVQQAGNGTLEIAPQWRLLGQDVVHATDGLQRFAHE